MLRPRSFYRSLSTALKVSEGGSLVRAPSRFALVYAPYAENSTRCPCCSKKKICASVITLSALIIVLSNGFSEYIGSSARMESLEGKKLLWLINMTPRMGLALSILSGMQGIFLDYFYKDKNLQVIADAISYRELPPAWEVYRLTLTERQFFLAMLFTSTLATLSAALSAVITYYFCKEEKYNHFTTGFLMALAVIGSLVSEVLTLGESFLKKASGKKDEEKYTNSWSNVFVLIGKILSWLAVPGELLFCYLLLEDEVPLEDYPKEIVRGGLAIIAVASYFGFMQSVIVDAMNALGVAIAENASYKKISNWILFPTAVVCAAAVTQASLTFLSDQLQNPDEGLPKETQPALWVDPFLAVSAMGCVFIQAAYSFVMLFNKIYHFFCCNKKNTISPTDDIENRQSVIDEKKPHQPLLGNQSAIFYRSTQSINSTSVSEKRCFGLC